MSLRILFLQVDVGAKKFSDETPSAILIRERQEQQQQALRAIQSDPIVQQLMRDFSASIVEDSVKPLL